MRFSTFIIVEFYGNYMKTYCDKRFCVYLHKRKDNDVCFYLGSGNEERPYKKTSRNPNWQKVTSETDYYVEHLAEDLSRDEAITLENWYLENPDISWQLVNVARASENNILKYDDICKYLDYCEDSITHLVWKIKYSNRALPGRKVGYPNPDGYYRVKLNDKKYLAHRLVWVLYNKTDLTSDLVIHHIDGNKSNNHPLNLKSVTQQTNAIERDKSFIKN
jgi:hypothetical protein